MRLPQYAFFEGEIVPIDQAKVSVATHAFNYGTAAFAGMRAYWNADREQLYIFRPHDHFERFKRCAEFLLIDLPYTSDELLDIVIRLLNLEKFREDAYIRPLVYKSQKGIGIRLHDLTSDMTIFALPFGNYLPDEEGVSVGFSSWRRIDDGMIPPRAKISGAYVNSALTKTEAHLNGYDEALVLDGEGHISEASAANFFMFRNGKVVTPPVYSNILEGITRQTCLLLLTEELGLEVIERPIDRTEIYSAQEAFLCGTGVQIAAITSVDHRKLGTGQMGPVVGELRQLFFDIVRGNNAKYRHWIEPVYQTASIATKSGTD